MDSSIYFSNYVIHESNLRMQDLDSLVRCVAMAVAKTRKTSVKKARESVYRSLVLDAAERVFAKKGYDGAKIKDVADEAGLALGTVYTIYPSKHDVFIAVHERRGGALLATVVDAITGIESPYDALAHGLVVTCRFYAAHPDYLRMHLGSGTAWAAPKLDVPEEQRVYRAGRAPLVALFERAASRADAACEPAETSASLFLAAMQVYFSEWVEGKFVMLPEEVAERVAGYVKRALIVG